MWLGKTQRHERVKMPLSGGFSVTDWFVELEINNCVAEWRWVPGMSRGFHLWHSQPLDRVTPPWLANPRPPAMSPHANGTRHPSHWFNSGRIKGGGGMGEKNDPKAKRREWLPRKHCTEHMEVMQPRLTALEPNDWLLTMPALLVVNCVK